MAGLSSLIFSSVERMRSISFTLSTSYGCVAIITERSMRSIGNPSGLLMSVPRILAMPRFVARITTVSYTHLTLPTNREV